MPSLKGVTRHWAALTDNCAEAMVMNLQGSSQRRGRRVAARGAGTAAERAGKRRRGDRVGACYSSDGNGVAALNVALLWQSSG
jgi:hypothetical protein